MSGFLDTGSLTTLSIAVLNAHRRVKRSTDAVEHTFHPVYCHYYVRVTFFKVCVSPCILIYIGGRYGDC